MRGAEYFETRSIPEPNTGCSYWLLSVGGSGYGHFKDDDGTWVDAHVGSYRANHGPVPPGHVVMHSCDTPLCVEPSHLSVGTQSQNMTDCHKRGRHPRSRKRATA